MVVNDRTASSRQLATHWSSVTGVLMSASSIRRRLLHRGMGARVLLYRIPLTANHRRLRLQWAHEHRSWQAVFSDESRFNMWDHDGCIHVRLYVGEHCLPECVIERYSALTPPELWLEVRFRILDDPICYELRVISILTGTSVKCYIPKSFSSFKASLELSFSRVVHAHMLQKTVRNFCSAQHMQLLSWPTYSPDMSPIEHV
ncbi:transposable element Tcb1 transposase [Trichonephila clavipes]|nr:transposable element Tcb1 transposase [Trichonephila clavipes]